jgi:hypothetical protein
MKDRGNLREEGNENNEQFCNTEIQRGCSLSVLTRGKKGEEEKCLSSTESAVEEKKLENM